MMIKMRAYSMYCKCATVFTNINNYVYCRLYLLVVGVDSFVHFRIMELSFKALPYNTPLTIIGNWSMYF